MSKTHARCPIAGCGAKLVWRACPECRGTGFGKSGMTPCWGCFGHAGEYVCPNRARADHQAKRERHDIGN